jgi:hypothetical protein
METRSGAGFRMVVCRLPLEAVSRPPVAVSG